MNATQVQDHPEVPHQQRLRTTPDGPEKFCPSCKDWWPADREFFWPAKGELSYVCKACHRERWGRGRPKASTLNTACGSVDTSPATPAETCAPSPVHNPGADSTSQHGIYTSLVFGICGRPPSRRSEPPRQATTSAGTTARGEPP